MSKPRTDINRLLMQVNHNFHHPTAASPQLCDRYGTPIKELCLHTSAQDICKLQGHFN